MSVKNPAAANEASAAFEEQKRGAAADRRELDETRKDLEGRDEPLDDAPETATADGGQLEAVDSAADGPPEAAIDESAGYTMSVDRRIGSTHLDVEYHAPGEEDAREGRFRFGKPNGFASREMFKPIEEVEESEGQSVDEMTDYIWGTLAEWCVEDDAPGVEDTPDAPAFWGGRMGLGDAINILRDLALGVDPNA